MTVTLNNGNNDNDQQPEPSWLGCLCVLAVPAILWLAWFMLNACIVIGGE